MGALVIGFIIYVGYFLYIRVLRCLLINESDGRRELNKNEVIRVPPRNIVSKYWQRYICRKSVPFIRAVRCLRKAHYKNIIIEKKDRALC